MVMTITHEPTVESAMAFDMDFAAPLVCAACGATFSGTAMLNHMIDNMVDEDDED